MEIGGYRELDLRTGMEYYRENSPARLNTGRSGIYHATRCLNCSKVLVPYYQCNTVRNFLLKKGIEVQYYQIGEDFLPRLENHAADTALIVVNYFGLIRTKLLTKLVSNNCNVIIDNTQGFYQPNIAGAYSVYSPRKFFGVSDGCYVIGEAAQKYFDEYDQDSSSSSANFLLARIETGGNFNYKQYLSNESRLDASDIKKMSKLTSALLDNIDYYYVQEKRQFNYDYAAKVFGQINILSKEFLQRQPEQVPMIYPLMIRQTDLRYILKENNVFVGQWWKYLLSQPESVGFERQLSEFLLPIQIDQRYGTKEIDFTANLIFKSVIDK